MGNMLVYPISRCHCKVEFLCLIEMFAMKGFSREMLTLFNYICESACFFSFLFKIFLLRCRFENLK